MSHGFMGISPIGYLYVAGFATFFAYLSQSIKGPGQPKYYASKEYVDLAKHAQPGIVPSYYYSTAKQ